MLFTILFWAFDEVFEKSLQVSILFSLVIHFSPDPTPTFAYVAASGNDTERGM